MIKKIRVLGVCGGNGLNLFPLRDYLTANIEPRAIFHTKKNSQWVLNFGDIPLYKRLPDLEPTDVIIGAPDCGHSSVLSYSRAKKLSNPLDNDSYQMFEGSLEKYKPKIFIMENLPKLLDTVDFSVRKAYENYRIHYRVDSVAQWGNSQKSRVRLIAVGVRKDVKFKIFWPKCTKPLKTVRTLLRGLGKTPIESLGHVREDDASYIPMYVEGARKITVKEARRLWKERKGEVRWKVANSKMVNQPGVYRLQWDSLPLTVRKQNRQFDPDGYMLSPRDIARIQGVPDNFRIWYDPQQHLYCINKGRATCAKSPPYELGTWIYRLLTKNGWL